MKKILNLTQHNATAEQKAEGVYDMPADKIGALRMALTFNALPSQAEILERADIIANLAHTEMGDSVMIGGAPYLMPALETALKEKGFKVLYSFTQRESVETTDAEGNVVKTAVFRHVGFIEV
jgi:hypothetical protein|nr:MAG TPA: hypothetical protein [Caudoviricetes sp.]